MTVYLGQKSRKKPTAILIVVALLVAGWYTLSKKISESTPPTPSVSTEELAKWEPAKWEGIRGIKWGAKPPTELKKDDTFPVEPGLPGFVAYYDPNENLKIGDANLSDVSYQFYNDQFFVFSATTRNPDALRAFLHALYGKQPRIESFRDSIHLVWSNDRVQIEYIHFNLSEASPDLVTAIYFPVFDNMQADKKKK